MLNFTKKLPVIIGELVLIIAGVLAAFAIESWHDGRQKRDSELQALAEFKAALQVDTADIRYNREYHAAGFQSARLLRSYLARGLPYHDSLRTHFGRVLNLSTFMWDSEPYQTLRVRGREAITDGEIRRMLSRLYSFDYGYARKLEVRHHAYHERYLMPYYFQHFRDLPPYDSASPHDYPALSADPTYVALLQWTAAHHATSARWYDTLHHRASRTITRLDSVITRLELEK